MKHLRTSIAILILLVFNGIKAQQYNFRNYSVKEGVAQSQVYSVIQDSKGLLWMGTRGGGITSFDGKEFKTLTQKDGLKSNYIFCIREDKNKRLWIGTNNGFSIYNGIEFKNYSYGHTDTTQMWVLDIDFDNEGSVFLATNFGLVKYEKGKFYNLTKLCGEYPVMVNAMCYDNKNNLYFGTNTGLSKLYQEQGQYKIKKYIRNQNYVRSSVNSLYFDKQNLWIGTYNDGVYLFHDETFARLNDDPFIKKQSVFDIFEDKHQNIWMATLNSGVIQYNKSNNTYSVLGETEGLSNNHVRSICTDQSGNLWFGTSGGGICNYFGNQFTHFDKSAGLAGNFIYSIFRDRKGRLIVGNSDKGISVFDSGKIINYNSSNRFSDIKVKAICEDDSGLIYLGTEAFGLTIMDGDSFYNIQTFNKKYVKSILKDFEGNIIVACSGAGIYKINRKNGFNDIENINLNSGLLSNRVSCLHQDNKGRLWYGTENNGLSYLENFKATAIKLNTLDGMPSNSIRCITESRKGVLYVGTAGNGIAQIPIYEGPFVIKTMNEKDGLSSLNIYLLEIDDKENLYSGTENGLDKIQLDSMGNVVGVKHYSKGEGFVGIETCQNAVWTDSDKSIWFGTINGLTKYMASEQFKNLIAPVLTIVDVRLFYESLNKTKYKSFIEDWNSIRRLDLPYNQNHLSFDFRAINFSNPDAVLYKWKLEGFDNDWSPETKQNTVTYSNLPNGNYVFKVISANEDGIWNENAQQLKFSIGSPFWKKWWVITLFSVLISTLIILLFRLRIKNIRKKASEAQEQLMMEKMLIELEQKALRLQMNPHFIFNALNSIQSQIGTDDGQSARYYLAKFSRLMRQILDNSRKSLIPLKEEINTLENYLLVEKFSNGDRFDYNIDIDPNLELDFIEIPPMLLQPFIENSIKHGLKNQTEKRGLIDIKIIEKNGLLECSVTDNGIGREQSSIINQNSKETYHQSTALKVTKERLEIIRNGKDYKSLEIIDLKDQNDIAIGTKVILRLPLE
jgi:ligand-binding sensor domain-containing protein